MRRVTFPQCLWGQEARKDTTLSGTVDEPEEFDVHGNGRCPHKSHELLMGLDEKGQFRTRKVQTYPPEFCERLAKCCVASWRRGRGRPVWMTKEELVALEEEVEEEAEEQLGEELEEDLKDKLEEESEGELEEDLWEELEGGEQRKN